MPKHKLSASALNVFLKSPRAYYWSYVKRLEPLMPSVATYDHDKLCGILWAEFVDRFYKRVTESANNTQMLQDWNNKTDGWVPDRQKDKLTKALESWASQYYQMFTPDDGARNGSELKLENERFVGYLDGLSHDKIIHEVKSTSRSPQLSGQLWKTQNSLQVKLYCVMAKATGVVIEYAFKDVPYQIYRAPKMEVSEAMCLQWEQQLNSLADYIYSLGDDINNYVCHSDGCNLITKNVTSLCSFHTLCDMGFNETTQITYKAKSHRQ